MRAACRAAAYADLLPARGEDSPRFIRSRRRRDLASLRGRTTRAAIDAFAGRHERHLLTNDLERGTAVVVPADCWQAAQLAPHAPWALCGCTVAPGFEFTDFEMPPAAELLAAFPAHERIVRQLTRS